MRGKPFQKGRIKTGGKKKGSRNKKVVVRETFMEICKGLGIDGLGDRKLVAEEVTRFKFSILKALKKMFLDVLVFDAEGNIKGIKLERIKTVHDLDSLVRLVFLVAGDPLQPGLPLNGNGETIPEATLRAIAGRRTNTKDEKGKDSDPKPGMTMTNKWDA